MNYRAKKTKKPITACILIYICMLPITHATNNMTTDDAINSITSSSIKKIKINTKNLKKLLDNNTQEFIVTFKEKNIIKNNNKSSSEHMREKSNKSKEKFKKEKQKYDIDITDDYSMVTVHGST